MNFGREVKEELFGKDPEKECCALAQLWAMISKRVKNPEIISSPEGGRAGGDRFLRLRAESIPEARLILRLFRRFTDKEVRWAAEDEKRLIRHQVVRMEIESSDEIEELLSYGNIKTGRAKKSLIQRNCCRRSFMRGIFLSGGSISAGKSGYHLEFTVKTEESCSQMSNILRILGLSPVTGKRRGHYLAYLKKGGEISSFLTQAGALRGMLKFEEERALKETRAHVNRLVNSESANLEKQAAASARYIHAIEKIHAAGLWKKMPYPLREIGEMRMLHPEFSFAELGEQFNPVIKKAAVGRRLRRLEERAENV